jgi:hypothetical protein
MSLPRNNCGAHGLAGALLGAALVARCAAGPELSYGDFASVRLYRPAGAARHLVLVMSGDGGWGEGMGRIALDLAAGDPAAAAEAFVHAAPGRPSAASPAWTTATMTVSGGGRSSSPGTGDSRVPQHR